MFWVRFSISCFVFQSTVNKYCWVHNCRRFWERRVTKNKVSVFIDLYSGKRIDNKQTQNVIINNNKALIVSVGIRVTIKNKTVLGEREWRRGWSEQFSQKAYLIMFHWRTDFNDVGHTGVWEKCIGDKNCL